MKKNLLYIDDDKDDHEVFQAALGMLSDKIKCTFLNNASEALYKLENEQIFPDLIFLDINMPVISGLEFLVEFKKLSQFNAFPVVIFSTTSNPLLVKTAKELGAVDYIVKPPSFDDLIEILNRYVMN